jgi:hypothetical protein
MGMGRCQELLHRGGRRLMSSLCVQGSTPRPTADIMHDFIHKVQPTLPRRTPRRADGTPQRPVLRSSWLAVVVVVRIEGCGRAIELEEGFRGQHLGRGANAKQATIQANHLGGNAQDHVELM